MFQVAGQGKCDSFRGVQGGKMRDVFPLSYGFSLVEGAQKSIWYQCKMITEEETRQQVCLSREKAGEGSHLLVCIYIHQETGKSQTAEGPK